MRLLAVTDFVGAGGAERQLVLLLEGLAPHVNCRLVALGEGAVSGAARHRGLPVKTVPRRHRADLAPAWVVSREIMRWRPTVVHAWGWMSVAAAGPACKALGIPLIDSSIRTGKLPRRSGMRLRRLPGKLFATAVVANSRAGLDAFGMGASGAVIPNGFDFARLGSTGRVPSCSDMTGFTVVMTGLMRAGKDFSTFIEAARRLSERTGGPCRFVCIGEGIEKPGLVRMGNDLTEKGLLEIRDQVEDVVALLKKAHVGVLLTDPSQAEGCANSILEYMACGLPVVATDSGGNPELVKDGVSGLLVEPSNPEAVVEALLTLYHNPALARRFGEEGRRAVETRFSADAMVQSYMRLYESLAAPR